MSSTRYFLERVQVITNGSMTSTNTITSSEVNTKNLNQLSVGFVWTGTPTGTFFIDSPADGFAGTTWQAIDLGSTISASGAAGQHSIALNDWPFSKIRVRYTNASGTGTLQAYIEGRGI